MKIVFATLLLFVFALPAFAGDEGGTIITTPEIDGALALQFIALAGVLGLILKSKR